MFSGNSLLAGNVLTELEKKHTHVDLQLHFTRGIGFRAADWPAFYLLALQTGCSSLK